VDGVRPGNVTLSNDHHPMFLSLHRLPATINVAFHRVPCLAFNHHRLLFTPLRQYSQSRMPIHEYAILNTGAKMPVLGLGTWKSPPGKVEHAVEYALKHAGYRHIDTAAGYSNEKEVGEAIKASGVPREEIFLTTKLMNTDQGGDEEKALFDSLKKLDTPYIDLWLMHWPCPAKKNGKPNLDHDWLTTWKTMEALYAKHPDKLKAIGISNFSVDYLNRLLPEVKVVPAVNQIEMHPSLPQFDIQKLCKEKGIVLTAYCPLGSDDSPLLTNEVVVKIAEKYKVHPANILISVWANTENTTVIPKSVTPHRIENNAKLVSLTDEEVSELLKIHETNLFRVCKPEWAGYGHIGFPDRK